MKLTIATPDSHLPPASANRVLSCPSLFSPKECDALIDAASALAPITGEGAYHASSLETLDNRDSIIRWVPPSDDFLWIYERLDQAITAANEGQLGLPLTALEILQFSQYGPGAHFGTHTDFGYLHATRHLSISVQLSDGQDYEGGDLEFLGASYVQAGSGDTHAAWDVVQGRASRNRGTAILFPSHLPHRVTPITSGQRLSLVGWVRGRPFE